MSSSFYQLSKVFDDIAARELTDKAEYMYNRSLVDSCKVCVSCSRLWLLTYIIVFISNRLLWIVCHSAKNASFFLYTKTFGFRKSHLFQLRLFCSFGPNLSQRPIVIVLLRMGSYVITLRIISYL